MNDVTQNTACDYLIIGAGVIGLCLGLKLMERSSDARVVIVEKEGSIAEHASGRNSGVLHAGFYYKPDTYKAKFTVAGNSTWRSFCEEEQLPINRCGKLVVADGPAQLEQLFELERRGKANGSNVEVIGAEAAREIEPNIRTHEKALWSPDTATVDPLLCCTKLVDKFRALGGEVRFDSAYTGCDGRRVLTSGGVFEPQVLINAAGLYADRIACDYGFGSKYTIIPFKGLYIKYTKNKTDLRTNVYPVPDLKYPFLGVHFTITVSGEIKIGPTAIPAFWRENYSGLSSFSFGELASIISQQARLFLSNSFGFRDLAFEEMRKYRLAYMVRQAQQLVQEIDPKGFTAYTKPGIRAQLLNKQTRELEQDFVIEGDRSSVHILNAVSPGFTCAFPFADFILERYLPSQ